MVRTEHRCCFGARADGAVSAWQRFSQSAYSWRTGRLVLDMVDQLRARWATLFCGMHGFSRAIGWDVIQTPTTYVIGSNRYCNADYCKGYSFIRCG
jgi:hypothetical protein